MAMILVSPRFNNGRSVNRFLEIHYCNASVDGAKPPGGGRIFGSPLVLATLSATSAPRRMSAALT
jgi:hypothetical protein